MICSLPHQRAHVRLCACSASNSQLFPPSLPVIPPPRPPLTHCWHTLIVCQLPASVNWNIFPQRAAFRGDEAQLVGVCGSNPSPRSRDGMGTKREVGGGLARGLALLSQRSQHCSRGSAGPSSSDVAVNAINMFVAGPAPLKGRSNHEVKISTHSHSQSLNRNQGLTDLRVFKCAPPCHIEHFWAATSFPIHCLLMNNGAEANFCSAAVQ